MGSGTQNVENATPDVPGTDVTKQIVLGGTAIYSLSRGGTRVSSGTYNSTEVFGFWVLATGTGDTITVNYIDGTQVVLTTAELDVMVAKDNFVPFHCSSIVLSDPAIEVIINRPPA